MNDSPCWNCDGYMTNACITCSLNEIEYTVSNDSEKIAAMLDSFHYQPDKKEVVLQKYNFKDEAHSDCNTCVNVNEVK